MSFVSISPQSDANDIEKYMDILPDCHTMTQKLEKLIDASSLTHNENQERSDIQKNLIELISKYYPWSEVHMYGSTSSGLATKESDLDMLFLPTPEYCQLGTEPKGNCYVPTLIQFKKGELPPEQLYQMNEKQQLQFLSQVFRFEKFKDLQFINAKCPILKFSVEMNDSSTVCDLSSRNKLVVYNTALLHVFQRIDERFKILVITLRYWAKKFGFIGQDGLSSYALTLLVIFFLQNCDPPVFPSVISLMEQHKSTSTTVAGWEVAFIEYVNNTPCNKDAVGELLRKFFEFFFEFDFTRYAVCVRTGSKLPIHQLTSSYSEKFVVSSICIQDPFELSRNVGKNMTEKIFLFQPCLFVASEILFTYPENRDYVDHRFKSLFDPVYYDNRIKSIIYLSNPDLTFFVKWNEAIILSLGNDKGLLYKWYVKASQTVIDFLRYGLLIDCTIVDTVDCILSQSVTDIDSLGNCILTVSCSVYDRTWVKRNSIVICPEVEDGRDFSSRILKEEYLISKSLVRLEPHLSCHSAITYFLCKFYKTGLIHLPHLVVELVPMKFCKEFTQIGQFLMSTIPKKVSQMLNEN